MKRVKAALGGLLLIVAVAAVSVRISADQAPKKLRVIYTTELAGFIEPCG